MEALEIVFCDLVQRFKLWLPRKVEQQVLSRDFWMPDQSCRVCYECDIPFSIFNRRHHCRICGRVFCGKCTQNTLPLIDSQTGRCHERERVRACNFCYKLKQEECKRQTNETVAKPSTQASTPSSSSFSVSSSGTSTTGSSSSTVSSTVNPSHISVPYGYKTSLSDRIDPIAEWKPAEPIHRGRKSIKSNSSKGRDVSPNPYDFCSNRSEDEVDDPNDGSLQTKRSSYVQSQEEEEDDSCIETELINIVPKQGPTDIVAGSIADINLYKNTDDNARNEEDNLRRENSLQVERSLSKRSTLSSDDYYEGPEESVDESNLYTPSLVHDSVQVVAEELVDVENNESIWVPPPPEDKDDEMTVSLADDADDEDGDSGWGSLSSSEYRIREKATASQEQRRAMRAVVDGHFRALVGQLLDGEGLDGDDCGKESWLEIVASMASQAASLFKPDTSKDGGMDPGAYVKVKCIASGKPSESCVIKGVVCKKNVAHRRMSSRYKSPRLLLLGGALEYQRVSNQLSSLDTLLQQEKDHLCMAASKIEAHRPNVVLVEKNVSRQAQEQLLAKEISLVLNVKRPLLERIARCTGAEIVPCPDQIMKAKLGHCDFFHVERFAEELGSVGQVGKSQGKTLMFFDGCPKPLGCTVLLRGGKVEELKKVKRVVQFAVFAAYQLALETSFLVDEGAAVPELSFRSPMLPSINSGTWSDLHRNTSSSTFAAPCSVTSSCFSSRSNSPSGSPRGSDAHGYSTRMFDNSRSRIISYSVLPASVGVPSEKRVLSKSQSTIYNMSIGIQNLTSMYRHGMRFSNTSLNQLEFTESENSALARQMLKMKTELENQAQNGFLGDQEANHEEFPPSPSDHQSILVSFSSTCLRKRRVCERGHLFRIKYYGSFDKPLGKFLKDTVFDPSNVCGICEEKRDAHLHCYMHRQGSLTISVHRQKEVLLGEHEGKIWMWHRCLKCPRLNNVPPATRRVLMSDAAWGLSFGKFLELSFSNHAAASRVAACGHSLHRDCLRFYGFGSMVACFRYVPIKVHSVYLPPSKLEFNHPDLDEWLVNERDEIRDKGKLVFSKHFNALRELEEQVVSSGIRKAPEIRRWIIECEASLMHDQKVFLESLQNAAPMRSHSCDLFADILKLNYTRRMLSTFSLQWDRKIMNVQASHKLHKVMLTSRSVNLHESSFLSGIKDGRLLETEEAPTDSACEVDELRRPVVTHDNVFGELLPTLKKASSDSVGDGMGTGSQAIAHVDGNLTDSSCLSSNIELNGQCHEQSSAMTLMNEVTGDIRASSYNVQPGSHDEEQDPKLFSKVHSSNEGILDNLTHHNQRDQLTDVPGSENLFEGNGQTVEAHEVHISSTGQEIASQGSTISLCVMLDEPVAAATVETDPEVAGDPASRSSAIVSLSEEVGCGSESVVACTPSSSVRGEKSEDPGLLETPVPNLYNIYNKVSPHSFNGLSTDDPHQLYNSYEAKLPLGEGRIFLPPGILDTIIPVYDDEPTSIIAYAITSQQYQSHLSDGTSERERFWDAEKESDTKQEVKDKDLDTPSTESAISHPLQNFENPSEQSESTPRDKIVRADETANMSSKESFNLQYLKATHVKVSFTEEDKPHGMVKFMVTCYYAKQFDALRKTCCSDQMDFVRSLCRCKKWGAQGGKSNVFFAKTKDDRFVIKQVTKTELESFIKFAPAYFKYLSETLKSGSPTCLAKILGIFQVTVKHWKPGKEVRMDLMVMENLLYGRHVTRLYDLKGSLRSRYNADTTGKNKVLLDQNLLESMLTNPIFIGNKAKRILERAVWNDTSFLASVDVMDYSLLVGIDEERCQLVLGIIDFMRQYTWDKHLESWVKASGILGGPKNAQPTVISPKQYKKRFRKAMKNYFLMVPDQWSPATEIFGPPHVDSVESFQSTA
ncbi:hypothetical protein KP509_36G038800 [Ceratopteris richardii]|uniref:1-phosphatidylinositol-3-phosphate 5-kinase n=1 Tax=Ceratopteris richardii TaxID=49495 RepID=A0A8T2QC61_CERRI|nr:hypothetical protein KP509_36G038800 [Ceratopteris richardii]